MKLNMRRLIYLTVAITIVIAVYYNQIYGEGKQTQYGDISVHEARVLIGDTEALIVLDVRTSAEYDDGHIEGAFNIPVNELPDRLDELVKNSEILVYCRSGNRSSTAIRILNDNGFIEIYHMSDGIMAWIEAGYPIVKS